MYSGKVITNSNYITKQLYSIQLTGPSDSNLPFALIHHFG